jgi:hypothetical protein
MAGCVAWFVAGLLRVRLHDWTHAGLSFAVAAMFAAAWLFYSRQPMR